MFIFVALVASREPATLGKGSGFSAVCCSTAGLDAGPMRGALSVLPQGYCASWSVKGLS